MMPVQRVLQRRACFVVVMSEDFGCVLSPPTCIPTCSRVRACAPSPGQATKAVDRHNRKPIMGSRFGFCSADNMCREFSVHGVDGMPAVHRGRFLPFMRGFLHSA